MHANDTTEHAQDANEQEVWEAKVRAEVARLGANPDETEAAAEGFGQDFAEWAHDPKGFAAEVVAEYGE